MDDSIVSREKMRERGAIAFDAGRGVDDHNMNPGSPAIKEYEFGWHERRIVRTREKQARQQAEVSP